MIRIDLGSFVFEGFNHAPSARRIKLVGAHSTVSVHFCLLESAAYLSVEFVYMWVNEESEAESIAFSNESLGHVGEVRRQVRPSG